MSKNLPVKITDLTLTPQSAGLINLKQNEFTKEQKQYLKQEIVILYACRNEELKPLVSEATQLHFSFREKPLDFSSVLLELASTEPSPPEVTPLPGNNPSPPEVTRDSHVYLC